MQENVIYFEEDSVDEIEVDGVIVWSDEDKTKASFVNVPLDRIYVGDNIVYGEDVVQPPIPPTVPPDNEYLEIVDIPEYDSTNPEHLLINESNGMWTESNLNNAAYTNFYIEPGTYGNITLTQNGTTEHRRTISLYGNNTHPASLNDDEQASVKLRWDDASYWTLDKISFLDYQDNSDINWFYNGSSFNTLNEIHLRDFYYGIRILHGCNNNTIQKSYIHAMTFDGIASDNVAIALTPADHSGTWDIHNTKIIDNDIRSCGDGVQLIRNNGDTPEDDDVDYQGTIIDGNLIWMDGDVYYDGNGNQNPDGDYMIGENALDLKRGSNNPDNPVVVTNNKFWGYKEGDENVPGSFDPIIGKALTIHYSVANLVFENNVVAESQRLFSVASQDGFKDGALDNASIKNNIFAYSGQVNDSGRRIDAIVLINTNDVTFEDNSLIDFVLDSEGGGLAIEIDDTSGGMNSFNNNLCISVNKTTSADEYAVHDNYYYDSNINFQSGSDIEGGDSGAAAMGDLTFEYERYTTTPKSKTIIGVITTDPSPHNGVAGSTIS